MGKSGHETGWEGLGMRQGGKVIQVTVELHCSWRERARARRAAMSMDCRQAALQKVRERTRTRRAPKHCLARATRLGLGLGLGLPPLASVVYSKTANDNHCKVI